MSALSSAGAVLFFGRGGAGLVAGLVAEDAAVRDVAAVRRFFLGRPDFWAISLIFAAMSLITTHKKRMSTVLKKC
jgi:hypothetical protein